ncbi:hypothetical protein KCU95_g4478, partial [Aureobasidium melanogenum]
MAEPLTVIDLSQDGINNQQAPNNALRNLIAIDQDFAEDLAIEVVREIEKLWPDLKAERFASQDIVDLSNALRTGEVLLEFRMLRAFLVLWKHGVNSLDLVSLEDLTNLAEAIYNLISRQLGPIEKQNSAAALVAPDVSNASKTDDVLNRVYTTGYSIEHSHIDYPATLYHIFMRSTSAVSILDIEYENGPEECQTLWPYLEQRFIPNAATLGIMAEGISAARFDLSFRLWRAYVVCWMTSAYNNPFMLLGERAKLIRIMALNIAGPENMVIHNSGGVTVLRKEGEKN